MEEKEKRQVAVAVAGVIASIDSDRLICLNSEDQHQCWEFNKQIYPKEDFEKGADSYTE